MGCFSFPAYAETFFVFSYGVNFRQSSELLRRICILWCLGEIFCGTGPFDLWCYLKSLLSFNFFFCSNGVSFSISATLYLFMCLELNLKPYVPLIAWNNLFTSQCFGLKSILSNITLAIPAFFSWFYLLGI